MSKLFKLKEWLTLDDAAEHLSILFGETVGKADILQLALDGALTLSVHLVNGADGCYGPIVPSDAATYTDFPIDPGAAMKAKSPEDYKGGYMKLLSNGVRLNTGEVIELGDDVVPLRGVFDLPMIGNERLDVQHEYQRLTGGPEVTLQGLDGPFLFDGDATYFQLQESFDENEFHAGSAARGAKLEALIQSEALDVETAEEMRAKFNADRERFKAKRGENWRSKDNYYPAGALPGDSVLVVRTAALLALQETASAPDGPDVELGTRERDTLLKLVIGMAVGGYGYSPVAARSQVPTEISSDLAKQGLSVSDDTVRKWLKVAANTVMPDNPPKS